MDDKNIPSKRKDGMYHAEDIPTKRWIEEEDLRAEAVKWIKGCDGFIKELTHCSCSGCQRFIEFFNLTEEDLKEATE